MPGLPPNNPIPMIVGVALVALLLYTSIRLLLAQRRRGALPLVASELGLSFESTPNSIPATSFDLMQRGRGRRVRNLMRGEIDGVMVEIFDFRFVTGFGGLRKTPTQTVVIVRHPTARLPAFRVESATAEHVGDALLGSRTVDFDVDTAFTRRYVVKARDHDAIRTVLDPAARARLVAARRGTIVDVRGAAVLVYRPDTLLQPDRYGATLTDVRELAEALWREGDRLR